MEGKAPFSHSLLDLLIEGRLGRVFFYVSALDGCGILSWLGFSGVGRFGGWRHVVLLARSGGIR